MIVAEGTQEPATAAAKLLAALAVVLNRYSDRSELVIGYANGAGPEPLALQVSLAPEPTFAELVARIDDAIAAAQSSASAEAGSMPDEPEVVVGLDREPPSRTAHPRWLTAHADPAGLRLELHADGGSGRAHGGDLLLGHLGTALRAASDDPERPIGALPVATDAELDQLLVQFNQTAAPYPRACLTELWVQQVARTPSATAVEFNGERLTYAELDERANRLAHYLATRGVGPEILVGICVERSLEMLVGLLGIMKAGGTYVPVDPAYPAERQAFMLTNSQAPVVVTQARLAATIPVADVEVVCLDRDWPAISACPAQAPDVVMDPEQLAYVIYTSGSTGQPKGVQISHRALVNFLTTMAQRPGLAADDVLVAVTTLSFDIAGLELYLPLITGARVVIAPTQTVGDPRALARLLADTRATVMQATPTTWRMLADSGWQPEPGMKALCGGEALPVALADRLVGLGLELWNMYGPTETTIWSTCARIETQGEPLTIGRPIANTTLYVLNRNLQPSPVGVPGELWIGGDGLARGYRGRPDLTEERFIPHPFHPALGARIYRTGDLARFRSDGSVDFLGRIDHQVKVRGFRIELGEIETVLSRHPGVAEAVVVARGDTGEAELAAYVIPAGEPVAAHDLREFLMQTLPAYMIPSTVTTLDAFPLTPNGKVDRKALPEPVRERSAHHEFVSPRSDLEKRLTAIWERELDVHPIGVTDNFFDLGVTSFAAAALFAAIEHELGSALPLGAIFSAPTIESLAGLLEGGGETSRWTSLIPIQPAGTQTPIFCVHGGAGTILHLADLARRLGSDQPFYGLQSRGLYGGVPPLHTVQEMAQHYLREMREVHPGGPWRLAGYCFGTIVAFEIAHELLAQGEQVELVAMFNGPSPAWIKRWGWYGNQPSWRLRHGVGGPALDEQQRKARRRRRKLDRALEALKRIPQALREPRRLVGGIAWYTRKPRTRILLALGRPVPEPLREEYFFDLHQKAERLYEPALYPGELLIFYGEGLYEDPTLGWDGLAAEGIRTYAVPGDHDNNRQAMHEPAVEFVADRLQEYLSDPGSRDAEALSAGAAS